jgi:nucleoside-diphosphate-sugar epimerase
MQVFITGGSGYLGRFIIIETLTLEEALRRMGPIAEAFALDQQLTGARAHRELGGTPTRLDALTELARG